MKFKNIVNAPLSKESIDQLKRIMKEDAQNHVRQRAHTILLVFRDQRTLEDVADFFKVHVNTIRNWVTRWSNEGVDGLYDLEGRGVKPRFSAVEEKLILECVDKEPRSLRQVAVMVEQKTGKTASVATFRLILKKHGKAWKRQRKILKGSPTEEELEQGKQDIKELKQLAQDGEFDLLYFDATGLSLVPCVPYAWQDIGREGTLGILSSSSKRINLFGFLDPMKNELTTFQPVGSVNGAAIIDIMNTFCDSLIKPAVVVLDNAPIQTSKAVMAHFRKWERRGLTLYFLPTYSPELNLIEILWRKIKYEWMPSSAYVSFNALKAALDNILSLFGSQYEIQFSA
jgi:transposase